LLFYNARYYDSNIAKFVSADTIVPTPTNPQSFNRYSYVDNNSIRFVDPSGHCKGELDGADKKCWEAFTSLRDGHLKGRIFLLITLMFWDGGELLSKAQINKVGLILAQ
jgi:hypothetical protein